MVYEVYKDQEIMDEEQENAKRQRIDEAAKNEEEQLEAVLKTYAENGPQAAVHQQGEESLHDLIKNHEWDRVVSMVEELRRKHKLGKEIPELHGKREVIPGIDGFTPLQCALNDKAEPKVINALVDTHTVRDRNEFLPIPLLRACEYIQDTQCIEKILYFHPEAVLEKQDGMSVFHVVLQNNPPLDLVEHLAQTWAEQKGVDFSTAWTKILEDRDDSGMLPLHYAIQEHASSQVILKLLGEYPGSAFKEVDCNGLSPVHVAVYRGCSQDVLEKLVEHCAGAISARKGADKTTPLHLLFHVDNKNRWLNNVKTPPGIMPPRKMAWCLIQKHAKHAQQKFGAKKADEKQVRPGN